MNQMNPVVSNETVMDTGAVLRAFSKRASKLGLFVIGTGVVLAVLFGQWPSLETDLFLVAVGMASALLLGICFIMFAAILSGEAYVVRPHRLTAVQNIAPTPPLDVRSPIAMDLEEPDIVGAGQNSKKSTSDAIEPEALEGDEGACVEQAEQIDRCDQSIDLRSLSAVAQRVVARSRDLQCCSILAAGSSLSIDATPEVLQVAREMAAAKISTVIVDLGAGTIPLSSTLGLPRSPGLTELLAGTAGFDAIIKRDPRSALQFIAAGKPRVRAEENIAYGLERIIDTLRDVYSCVILFADPVTAKSLRKKLGGQIAIGLEFADETGNCGSGTVSEFLGEPSASLQVIRYIRPGQKKRGLFRSLFSAGAAA